MSQTSFWATCSLNLANPGGFIPVGNGSISPQAGATEANGQIICRTAGTFSNLYCRVHDNPAGGGVLTVRFRKNTGNGNQVLSVADGATGEFLDSAHNDVVVVTDKVDYQSSAGGGFTGHFTCIATNFTSTAQTERLTCAGNMAFILSGTVYAFLGGYPGALTSETNTQYKFEMKGTLQNLQTHASVNTNSNAVTVRTRIGGGNGNQSLSVTAGTTGFFEDTVNSDLISTGSLVNYSMTQPSGGTINLTLNSISSEFTSTGNGVVYMASGGIGEIGTETFYNGMTGLTGYQPPTITEAGKRIKTELAQTFRFLACRVSANTVAAASTLTFRVNSGAGNETLSIGSIATGYFEDAVNSDTIAATDEADYQFVAGAGTTLQQVSVQLIAIQSGAGNPSSPFMLMLLGVY